MIEAELWALWRADRVPGQSPEERASHEAVRACGWGCYWCGRGHDETTLVRKPQT